MWTKPPTPIHTPRNPPPSRVSVHTILPVATYSAEVTYVDDDDPIEDVSEVSPPKVNPQRVKKMVQEIEGKQSSEAVNNRVFPRLDLETMSMNSKPQKIKNGMKPKAFLIHFFGYLYFNCFGNQNVQSTLTRTTFTRTNLPEPTKPSEKSKFLPIKAWYLGAKFFDEAYHLEFDSAGKMTIRSGEEPRGPARHAEEIDVRSVASRVRFMDPQNELDGKILVLETLTSSRKGKAAIGTAYAQQFKQGAGANRGRGKITVQFDNLSINAYRDFVEWLKKRVDNHETIRGPGGMAVWEEASRIAELAETRDQRETAEAAGGFLAGPSRTSGANKLPVKAAESDDDWTPPAVPNMAKRTRPGSFNKPIEIESPTMPAPRPRATKNTDRNLKSNSHSESEPQSRSEIEPQRRSTRQSVAPQRPSADPDEVILVYPPGQAGAVNITNSDLTRLAPGEFLNDTLIEFGLKLWLQGLEKDHPELVKQIHVFSSFFYKKLNKKNFQEGYASVRKWTNKIDLFGKKYIIIPINENLHWYLAIIYHPEHILNPLPPPPLKNTPTTRRKARQEAAKSPEIDHPLYSARPPDSKASSVTRGTPTPMETAGGSGTLSPNSNAAEAEVVDELTACSINEDSPPSHEVTDKPDSDAGDDVDDFDSLFDEDEKMDVDGSHSGDSQTASDGRDPDPQDMEVDELEEDTEKSTDDPLDFLSKQSPPSAPTSFAPVESGSFYGHSKGKRKAESPPVLAAEPEEASPSEALDDRIEEEVVVVGEQPRTYVFTLDSLGTRHPKVVSVLSEYLQHEALEKKMIPLDMSSTPIGRPALVPHQPNFCDCGIYLLHLAETFISDPLRYYNLILTKKKSHYSSSERQADWNDDGTKDLRGKLKERIEDLSTEWKKDRAAKKELEKTQEEAAPDSSDDEIDIVDTTPAPEKEKTPKKAKRIR
ncbi:hypothetical protein GGX14DRAFT_474847 [Mycena pura]|uniref:Ubiquitin-like protease family profile domain-containing protein n=1 Tax=Mycena pura TaxID=153505 RepID=A0AAD6UVN6_9AGAR|nr:hypothetical protein GGX14DRAFT_474847 [Mycena pura]